MLKFHCVIVLENSLKGTIISIIVWSIGWDKKDKKRKGLVWSCEPFSEEARPAHGLIQRTSTREHSWRVHIINGAWMLTPTNKAFKKLIINIYLKG